jgi:predicted porin
MRRNRMAQAKKENLVAALTIFTILTVNIGGIAKAADENNLALKAPPELPDLTWKGITFIGAIDVSAQYEAKGSPYVANGNYGPASLISPWNRTPTWLLAPNQEQFSFWGFKVVEPLSQDLKFIARLESGFIPTNGMLDDNLKGVQLANGIPLNQQPSNGDGARAGELFNGDAYAGLESATYGRFMFGRNQALSTDMVGAYDPLASMGFSLVGYVGFLAGAGSAETPKVDESAKYMNTIGHVRVSALYAHPDSNVKTMYQGTIGFVYPEWSFDLLAGHTADEISVTSLVGSQFVGSQFLGARVFDTNIYGAFGKYTFFLNSSLPGAVDSKLTFGGGFAYLDFANPADGGYLPGHSTIGGYQIGPALSTNGSIATGVVNYGYTGGDRIMNVSLINAKYEYNPQWSFAVGYYRYGQNSFGLGVNGVPGVVAPTYSSTKCSSAQFFNCSGTEQAVSFRMDYQWNKNLNLYAGVAYSEVDGGFAFGFLNHSTFDPTIGMRYRW